MITGFYNLQKKASEYVIVHFFSVSRYKIYAKFLKKKDRK